jgi:AraC family transcriptional regulator, regulatory protein of adaptative response / methylated-DNA-[protein]-cysteine methyltransferase
MHYYSKVETTAGCFWIACSQTGITMISLAEGSSKTFEAAYRKLFGIRPEQGEIPKSYTRAVMDAAAGREPKTVPVDLCKLTEFQKKVLNALRLVPRGEIRTYKELAALAGRPKAIRAVGNTMARNPVPLLIPCHRVVPSTGGVGNYGLGVQLKRELLSREGVQVDEL